MVIALLIRIIEALFSRKLNYFITNRIEGKQSFAIERNGKIVLMEEDEERLISADYPYEVDCLPEYADLIWEQTNKRRVMKEYIGNKKHLKHAMKWLSKE
jgi:hypothetical protein